MKRKRSEDRERRVAVWLPRRSPPSLTPRRLQRSSSDHASEKNHACSRRCVSGGGWVLSPL